MYKSSPSKLSSEQFSCNLQCKRLSGPGLRLRAMYSSYVGGITTDVSLMSIPIDDHMVHRGHGVYDSGGVSARALAEVDSHVHRLLHSAIEAGIHIPNDWSHESIVNIVRCTIEAAENLDGAYRIFLSSGPGGFGIHSSECEETCLYVIVYNRAEGLESGTPISEITVSTGHIPMKPANLARIKSVNYLPNVLLADFARTHGGNFGLWVDESHKLKEGSIVSVFLISKDNIIISPSSGDILEGCTVRTLARICEQLNLVSSVEFRDVDVSELYSAIEVIVCGGDEMLYPVTCVDGTLISSGVVGPVCKALLAMSRPLSSL